MNKFTLCGTLTIVLGVILFNPTPATAECCYANDEDYCNDGSGATPYCGYGGCNFFGCNCDGGCRRGRKRDVNPEGPTFHPLDVNQDGLIDMNEAQGLASIHSVNKRQVQRQFQAFDADGNGVLDRYELDQL